MKTTPVSLPLTLFVLLLFIGCSSNNQVFTSGPSNSGTGDVQVHLKDSTHNTVPQGLQQPLTFTAFDASGQTVFGPQSFEFQNSLTLKDVSSTAETLLVETSAAGDSLFAEAPLFVDVDGLSFVTDLSLRPARAGEAAILAQGTAEAVAVGGGFIQTETSDIGERGANGVMAGARAFSVTSSLPHPYRTNSWLTPLMAADNVSETFLGESFTTGEPQVVTQLPIYPHPWALYYRNDGTPASQGLLLTPERVRVTPGANVPGPAGPEENSSAQMAEIQSSFDVASMKVDPGFFSYAMKVHRQGDFDCELIMRSLDDRDHDLYGLNEASALKVSLVRGSPFLHFTAVQLPQVKIQNFFASPDVVNTPGTVQIGDKTIGYNVLSGDYADGRRLTNVLFWDSSQATYNASPNIDSSLVFSDPSATNYFAQCLLPSESGSDQATLRALAEKAFSFPTDSTVTYSYDQNNQTVDAVYQVSTSNVLGLAESTLTGLLPHHYLPNPVHNNDPVLVSAATPFTIAGKQVEFLTPRGRLKLFDGSTFTCRYQFSGVLPKLPALDATDTEGLAELADWIDVFTRRHGNDNPPYTNINAGRGQSAYPLLKFLGRNVIAANVIEDFGNSTLASTIRQNTKDAIELYFGQTPAHPPGLERPGEGQAPLYFYYDREVGCLNQYPASLGPSTIFPADTNDPPWDEFGSISRLNDHHFHFGYMINAAAQLALADPAWGARWKDAINQLVFDVANDPSVNPSPILEFPKTRNWDPYMNYGMAAGFNWNVNIGNNEESISEHMNFWAGVILWGAATNQPAIMEHGIKYYAAAAHSSWMYWYDPADLYRDIITQSGGIARNWPGNGAARIFDAFTRWDTFFGIHPAAGRGITMFPFTAGHFYHAMNTDYVNRVMSDYDNFVGRFNIDPLNPNGFADWRSLENPWLPFTNFYGVMAKYAALGDPENALTRYFPVAANFDVVGGIVPNDKLTDIGDSGVFIYSMVRYLQTHGQPDPWVRATNTPFFMTFLDRDSGARTYVGYNHTSTPLTITFSDSTSIDDVAPGELGTIVIP